LQNAGQAVYRLADAAQDNFPMSRIKFLPHAQHSNQIHTNFALDTAAYWPYSARNLWWPNWPLLGTPPIKPGTFRPTPGGTSRAGCSADAIDRRREPKEQKRSQGIRVSRYGKPWRDAGATLRGTRVALL